MLRIVLCGLVAGVVWFLLSALSFSLLAPDFAAFADRGGSYPRADGSVFFAIDLLMGIWTVWLYTAIVPRYGAGPKTAAIAGLAWWSLKSLQSAKWVGLGLLPRGIVLVPLATTLVAVLVAAVLGAWLHDRVDPVQLPSTPPVNNR